MKEILDEFYQEDAFPKEELELFMGPNSEYFMEERLKINAGNFLSFNVYAFLFSIFWMLYRQMFRPTILLLSLYFAENYLENLLFSKLGIPVFQPDWTYFRIFAMMLITGFLGNWMYIKHCEYEVLQVIEKYEHEVALDILKHKGGTSIFPVIIFILLIFIIVTVQLFYGQHYFNTNFIY